MMYRLLQLVILSIILLYLTRSEYAFHLKKQRNEATYCNPTKADKLNVHIISHTHLDAGWVKTYDGYYEDSVKEIYRTVIESLTNSEGLESRKFTFVEMTYFSRYWNDISDKEKQVIRDLVLRGKLQFTSGGWVMNDEATPHYSMIIDQMSYGHRWISNTFGPEFHPSTGWQIDPFGHSKEFASILSEMGFNALFLGRIDYQDKDKRMANKSMEFIWKTDPNLKNYLLTGITPTGYFPSEGVCMNCDYLQNAENLIRESMIQIKGFRSNHLMATMGGDFNYYFAEYGFKMLDQMINYTNTKQKDLHLVYSTPDCYVKALYESNIDWTDTKSDDFLPYADKRNDFWSGYFTSRPAFKYFMNYINNILQVSKQLTALADIHSKAVELIRPLEESIGICLHHDSISGTSKQFVSDDYTQMLSNGLAVSEELITLAYQRLFNSALTPHFCHQLNISQCLYLEESNGFPVQIQVFNPLAHRSSAFIRLPLIDPNFQIIDANKEVVESQIIPIPQFIQSLSERNSKAKYEILFDAILEPLAFTKFHLENILTPRQAPESLPVVEDGIKDTVISNGKLSLTIDGITGLLKALQFNDISIPIQQNFAFYSRGSNLRNSGAYSFHTSGPEATVVSEKASISVIKGNLTIEVIQKFNSWLKQVIRVYKDSDYVEFDWTVGPLPDDIDFELISQFESELRNDKTFYTDSNGRQTLERKRDFRPTWNLDTDETVSSNYYPITSWLFIRDVLSGLQLTVLPDRTQGGSSIKDGSIELMIHRRLHRDDGYGMEEALNEPGVDDKGLVVRGRHWLLIDKIDESMKKVKILSKKLFWKPLPLFLPVLDNSIDLESKSDSTSNGLRISDKIDNLVHLLTLEQLDENLLFIRLEYFLEKDETNRESVSVDLNQLFSGVEVVDLIETSLTGTESLDRMKSRKYKWICAECDHQFESRHQTQSLSNSTITLNRNQIRSFILNVKRNYLNNI